MPSRRLVILDKNFLQKENHCTPRLQALFMAGCDFVLTDSLLYEICSDSRLPQLWPSIQKKLFPFVDRLHLWFHVSELLQREVAQNKPIDGPEDADSTYQIRDWIRSGRVYVPNDFADIVQSTYRQREVDTFERVAPMAREVGAIIAGNLRSNATKDDIRDWIQNNFNDDGLVRLMLRRCYGDRHSQRNHIPNAENHVTPEWFAFQYARTTLALACIFLVKYGFSESPGKKFPNTMVDTDYLALLHYADALASDETSGDMAQLFGWLYGSTKKSISSDRLFATIPSEDAVRVNAYYRWCESGSTLGSDLDDWLNAEKQLYCDMWESL